MLDEMRKYVRFGLAALSSQGSGGAGDPARSRAQAMAEQFSTLAAGFLQWSAEARASLLQELKDLVARQVEEMGVATKKDLEELRARLEELEGRAPRKKSEGRATGVVRSKSSTGSVRAGRVAPSRAARSKAASSSKKPGPARGRASRGSR